ncbi:MAG: MarR family transcriptional regulator [Clostridiales bacterium]|nr:MarR family transcriptional regulator [Clostridiales bacterium]
MEINPHVIKLLQTIKEMENLEFFSENDVLSKTEFRLLQEVIVEGEKGNMLISAELARRLRITRSAVSQIVCKLEARGIVKRIPDEVDRKIAYVQLTDETLALFNQQLVRVNKFMERVVKEYGEDRIAELIRSYDEFAAVMKRLQGEMKDEQGK